MSRYGVIISDSLTPTYDRVIWFETRTNAEDFKSLWDDLIAKEYGGSSEIFEERRDLKPYDNTFEVVTIAILAMIIILLVLILCMIEVGAL